MRGRKKLFRVILATICTGSVMAFSGMSASAYVVLAGYLEGGVYNRTYAIQGDVPFIDSAVQAFADWNWVLNPDNNGDGVDFYFSRISGEFIDEKAVIYIYRNYDSSVRYSGLTTFYKGAAVRPNETSWEHCEIEINEANEPTYNYFQEMRKIINHEIGHCIGLEENPYDNGTIMYPFWQTCTAYSPTLDDITGVRAKY